MKIQEFKTLLKNNHHYLFLALLVVVAFIWRYKGLTARYSFWTDEGHVAIFARAILQRGKPILANGYLTGTYQLAWYWLTAISMKVFGMDEFGGRLPGLFFGILTIPAVFLLGKKLFDKNIGLVSAMMTTFLTIEILWSRQARPYQAIQFFYLLDFIFFFEILDPSDRKKVSFFWPIFGLVGSVIISSLMHWFGLLPIVFIFFYILLVRFDVLKMALANIRNFLKKNLFFGSILLTFAAISIFFALYKINFFYAIVEFVFPIPGKISLYNYFSYYHSFLWRQHGLLIFLAELGLLLSFIKNKRQTLFFIIVILITLGFVSFRLEQSYSRYLYPIFPVFIIYFSYFLSEFSELLAKSRPKKSALPLKNIFLFGIALFIIGNGYKFTIKPKSTYSINSDMQEIPEVDYKEIYSFIKSKTGSTQPWILLTTWADHATWYLGESKPDFWLRKKEVMGGENIDLLTGAPVISDLASLKEIIKKNKSGVILIESWELYIPDGMKDFAENNLKKEKLVDRIYPVQPRYWPVEIYSWGL